MFSSMTVAIAQQPEVVVETTRRVWVPGEEAQVVMRVAGATAVDLDFQGYFQQRLPVVDGRAVWTLATGQWRSGDYVLHVRPVREGATEVAVDALPLTWTLTIGRPHDAERFPVWRWGHLHGEMDMAWFRQRGFTGATLSAVRHPVSGPVPDTVAALEEAARHDFAVGAYLHPLYAPELRDRTAWHTQLADGTTVQNDPYPVYPLEPEVLAYVDQVAETWLTHHGDYPALRHALLSSEYRTRAGVNASALQLAMADEGLDLRQFVANGWLRPVSRDVPQGGLIADDEPTYRLRRWWYERGDGVTLVNQRMAERIRQQRPDVLTWHDPWRKAPVRGTHTGMDAIGSWTYGHPDLKMLAFTTYLQAAARPAGQQVQQNITLFLYGHFVMPLADSKADFAEDFPQGDPYFNAGPDYATFATWLSFSQRPDILTYYWASRLSPEDDRQDPALTAPETFDAIGRVSRQLIEPYGPLMRRSQRVRPNVAMLVSAASRWFADSPRWPGNDNEQTLPYASLLMMNHVPFEVVLDEDLVDGGLDHYEILVLPKADTLTQSMHRQIQAFLARGGRVIADPSLRADLGGVIRTDFDFTFLNRIDGRFLARGEAVTAEEGRERMEAYAAQMALWLDGAFRSATADSPRVLVNAVDAGAARYHFLLNDAWAYGPRFGQWQLHQELGVRQSARVRIPLTEGGVLYDAIRQQPLAFEREGEDAVLSLALPAAAGRLVVALPEAIGSVELQLPKTLVRGEEAAFTIRVLGESGRGLAADHPVQVAVIDPLGRQVVASRYGVAAASGEPWRFTPARNDEPGLWRIRVTDLVAGHSVEERVSCQ